MNNHPFDRLTPDFILDAIEARGWLCDGRMLALNSYENRVYQVGIEESDPIIAKFYRPGRWSREQILEEHAFSFDLARHELPAVVPLLNREGSSLVHYEGFDIALFERRGGHSAEPDYGNNLSILGRLLARMHRVGASQRFERRPKLDLDSYARESAELISRQFMPTELLTAYRTLSDDLIDLMQRRIGETDGVQLIRVHGDCHSGNILWRDDTPHFVDFDDARMAPAVQDIWMLLSGEIQEQQRQMRKILDAYLEFNDFNFAELNLVEVLRTLRIMHYSAWLARRWEDPAFPRSFPWFNTTRYWEEHILELREQFAALQQPPLRPA
jgi:Ser/Thr protein kinase RdoA (MazF antagonist)